MNTIHKFVLGFMLSNEGNISTLKEILGRSKCVDIHEPSMS